jgi:hypothetical protein
MTQQEIDDWDEREEMLVRGLIKEGQNRRASDNEAIGSLTRSYEECQPGD